ISDIAERAGLSHGSFYHYFDSKEEVFREVAAAADERLGAPLGEVMLDPSSHAPPAERMYEAMRRYFEAYRAESRIMGVIGQLSRQGGGAAGLRGARQRRYAEQTAESIRQWRRGGQADARLKPAVAAAALGSMTARFAETWLVQGAIKTSMEDAVEQLALLF